MEQKKPKCIVRDWKDIEEQARKLVFTFGKHSREQAVSKLFVDKFLAMFGFSAIEIGSFEHQVAKLGNKSGFIDCFIPGKLLIEFKSRGKDLDKALLQGLDYLSGLAKEEMPRYLLICDFGRFRLHDLLDRTKDVDFTLEELPKQVKLFKFLLGEESEQTAHELSIDVKASNLMGKLHDSIRKDGYEGKELEVLLVRLLFCLFADDTGIFEHNSFKKLIEQRTGDDPSSMFSLFARLFAILNTKEEKRGNNTAEYLANFPYINGRLFEEQFPLPDSTREMRDALLECCEMDWSEISPAIFGSMFQTIMEEGEGNRRREQGAHYTSETNILKLIRPLFLDDLEKEFAACGKNKAKLETFHDKLSTLKFLDPACGCGNFLVVAYREIRRLELKVLDLLHPPVNKLGFRQMGLGLAEIVRVNVDQFYGIEVEEFPAQIAQVALWLVDHQVNMEVSKLFCQTFKRIPLNKSPSITCGNALKAPWPAADYIMGNPPFIGHQWRDVHQMDDMERIWGKDGKFGRLDYVTCWHRKATDYMVLNPKTKTAFVSTNSICQGEQVGTLWEWMLAQGIKIHFAHRTFQWHNEARGKAAVHCIIVGFGLGDVKDKIIFEYDSIKGEPRAVKSNNINPYLVDAPSVILPSRTKTPEGLPQLIKGSQPTDGGHLIMTDEQKAALLAKEPNAKKWIKKYIGGEELINGGQRWCLWLKGIEPDELKKLPEVMKRVALVAENRKKSPTLSVREFAAYPTLFTQDRQPGSNYLAIPEVSSESRKFIPIGFLTTSTIASNKLQIISGATAYHFGILSSSMHNAWMRTVAGRLKSDYSYSPSVYNNFPWPQSATEKQHMSVMEKAQKVLDARAAHPKSTLADMYAPTSMPKDLIDAHKDLDKAVDAAYGYAGGKDDAARVAYLFGLYGEMVK